MLVGDPKQSIYRFRRADVAVWTGVEHDFAGRGLGGVVTLEENFRSVAPILALVDAAVGTALDAPLDGKEHQPFEVRYAPVTPTREAAGADPVVELLVVPPDPDGKAYRIDDARMIEAAAIAARAKELVASGHAKKDMALLLAAWGKLEIYERALRAAGLDTYALRTEGFYDCREVLDLILLLEVVRDPRDDRALLGWLRSPFVGARDETLLALARAGAAPRWEHLRTAATGEAGLLSSAADILEEAVALRDRIPTCELLERLLERTGYLGYLSLSGEDGKQAIANVRKLVRMARQQPEQGLGDFLRVAHEARARGAMEGSARLYGEDDDVITITTIHSAKGLEWPIVFWGDLARGPNPGARDAIVVGRDAIALKDPDLEEQSVQWTGLCASEEREGEAERKRLWYVAATRAKDRLILGGFSAKVNERSPAGAIWKNLEGGTPRPGTIDFTGRNGTRHRALVRICEVPAELTSPVGTVEPLPIEQPAPESCVLLATRAGRARHSATSLMKFERCERRHWFGYVAGLREPDRVADGAGATGEWGPNATVRGQIVHDVLEHHGDDDLDLLLEDAIGRWDPDAPTPEVAAGQRYREGLKEEIDLVAGHPDYRAIADLPTARRELAFVHVAGRDASGRDAIVEGQIDLAGRAADGVVLLDVKTHQAAGAELQAVVAGYATQRDAYVSAVEAIGGQPVARFAFQFSRAATQLAEEVTAEGRAQAGARVAALLEAVGGAAPALARDPAECRHCGYRRAGWCAGTEQDAGA
jgi:ATP-dependent helicase/nuclease subunit A